MYILIPRPSISTSTVPKHTVFLRNSKYMGITTTKLFKLTRLSPTSISLFVFAFIHPFAKFRLDIQRISQYFYDLLSNANK